MRADRDVPTVGCHQYQITTKKVKKTMFRNKTGRCNQPEINQSEKPWQTQK